MANPEKPWKAEYAKTGRSKCRTCHEFIAQDLLRLGIIVDASSFDGLITEWHHADCIFKKEGQIKSVDDVEGLNLLRLDDQQKIKLYINPRGAGPDEQPRRGFVERLLHVLFPWGARRAKKVRRRPAGYVFPAARQAKWEEQNKAVWHLKDELKKHVKTEELRGMLKANGMYSKGSENDLRESCADGMLFGALYTCHVCRTDSIRLIGGRYRCQGYESPHTRCSFSTSYPTRLDVKWKIPPGTNNKYLLEWFDSQEAEKPIRIFPPPSADEPVVYDQESLQNLKVVISGKPADGTLAKVQDSLEMNLKAAGAEFYTKVQKDTSCLVWHGKMDDNNSEIKSARRLKIPIVRLVYLEECLRKRKILSPYNFEATSPYIEMVPVAVKEPAVDEASGLLDTGHILQDGENIYITTLNKTDLVTAANSYYILQIIQEGEDPDCYLFRKWGKIGHDAIGDSMKEKMPMSAAIEQFKRLFERQTGNPWESWKPKDLDDKFVRREGKYNPVNIDHYVEYVRPFQLEGSSSQLPPQVKELMEWICNDQISRADSMKIYLNTDELPLGKLTKAGIDKGLKILRTMSDLLLQSGVVHDSDVKRSIINLSNDFYNVIPSIHPRPISDKEDINAKRQMLVDLTVMENFMERSGISIEVGASLDENYKELRCEVKPLPQDSDDYKLVEKYFLNTRSPLPNSIDGRTWDLELEEVFEVIREEEADEHGSSYGDALHNRMLLWHGSRSRNVLGILGQGLMVAPEAELAVANSFGKGIYFCDLVSKSAEDCYMENGPALMFLAEVALGDTYELKEYKHIKELPQGKHSVKGVGRVKPSEKGYVTWRDKVMVPCGKPTAARIESQLGCNEYVVYNAVQVKLRFLVKLTFGPRM